MLFISADKINVSIDVQKGVISSLRLGGVERCADFCPLFTIRFRDRDGNCHYISSSEATVSKITQYGLLYRGFGKEFFELSVKIFIRASNKIEWQIEIVGVKSTYAIEWIEFPKVCFPPLEENDVKGGKILFPYNEGMLVSNEKLLPRYEPEFPSSGAYFMFPNMVCSQFMAYLFNGIGLYIGAHDGTRGLKGVDFYPHGKGLVLTMRPYSGLDFGQSYKSPFPIVWQACDGDWRSACEIYRSWFENNLPKDVTPINKNTALPSWYEDSPLIITYPVRGTHDTDKMEPNALFPYINALPVLDKIKKSTKCQIMALLMHWEGTAPWAPPYAWPPFGGEEAFNKFKDALHQRGDLLGVYCSGFGYTLRSTLIESYDCEEKIKNENVLRGVCHSPQNKPELGITCTPYQRYGYDICPSSQRGKELLCEGFYPIFKSGVDYAQILDQNHGGAQYMCYAREHNHPPMPGEWMSFNMQKLLKEWNEVAQGMLFGCESAAAEPFIGNLLMSDNRYELNYPFGTPVPLYTYIYHEYVRNFMGNQCGCPFEPKCDTLRYRIGYSFSIGDLITLVIAPNGNLMSHWGSRDFESPPNMEKTLLFIKNLMEFYRSKAKKYLYFGRMCNSKDIECDKTEIPMYRGMPVAILPCLLSSCWEAENGKRAYIVVNPEDRAINFKLDGTNYTAPALDAVLIIK